jgi:hypothetical protein
VRHVRHVNDHLEHHAADARRAQVSGCAALGAGVTCGVRCARGSACATLGGGRGRRQLPRQLQLLPAADDAAGRQAARAACYILLHEALYLEIEISEAEEGEQLDTKPRLILE